MKRSEFFGVLGVGAAATAVVAAGELSVGDQVVTPSGDSNQLVHVHISGPVIAESDMQQMIAEHVASAIKRGEISINVTPA